MSLDNFRSNTVEVQSPAVDGFAITPHDTNPLTHVTRAIYVGGGGHLNVVMLGGTTVLFSNVPAGSLLPIRVRQVLATGTTATLLDGLV
jgi:hypothetical protein